MGGGSLVYGLFAPSGVRLAGRSPAAPGPDGKPRLGWTERPEAPDEQEADEETPDIVRMLTTRLADGAFLVVGDERTAVDSVMRDITEAFAWALGAELALGLGGGIWLSRQFLRRLAIMRTAAQAVMAGDWRQPIPESVVDDDLAALARTFNRLFDRIEKRLLAQKHVGSDIAHDLRRPLAKVLREFERSRGRDAAKAVDRAVEGIEEVLQTFDALLRIGEVESGARRAAFAPLEHHARRSRPRRGEGARTRFRCLALLGAAQRRSARRRRGRARSSDDAHVRGLIPRPRTFGPLIGAALALKQESTDRTHDPSKRPSLG